MCEATVYLIKKNHERYELNFLQMESVEIKDDNKQQKSNKEGQGDQELDSISTKNDPTGKRKKELDLDKIGNTIVGLKTYEVTVTEE